MEALLQSCKIAHNFNFFHPTLFISLHHSYVVHSALSYYDGKDIDMSYFEKLKHLQIEQLGQGYSNNLLHGEMFSLFQEYVFCPFAICILLYVWDTIVTRGSNMEFIAWVCAQPVLMIIKAFCTMHYEGTK